MDLSKSRFNAKNGELYLSLLRETKDMQESVLVLEVGKKLDYKVIFKPGDTEWSQWMS